jgi:hypothetical protein
VELRVARILIFEYTTANEPAQLRALKDLAESIVVQRRARPATSNQ